MDNILGVLFGGLITAVAGLVGLRLARKNEHDQWLRDHKLEVYSEVSARLEAMMHSAVVQLNTGQTYTDQAGSVEQAMEASRQVSRLMLLAPETVIEYAVEAQKSVFALVAVSPAEFMASQSSAITALGKLNVHARLDLHGGIDAGADMSVVERWNSYFSRNLKR